MKLPLLLLLAALAAPVSAAPVHIVLKSGVSVRPDADGFFSLSSVADLSGGAPALRTRLAAIPVGRAPLSGETRRLTRGDLALKLRQAGCDPDRETILEGASEAEVTSLEPSPEPGTADKTTDAAPVLLLSRGATSTPSSPALPVPGATRQPGPVLHRGDAVTILIQSGALTVSAPGLARENGGPGDRVRVHREGVMTDLSVTVLDAKTVQLEI